MGYVAVFERAFKFFPVDGEARRQVVCRAVADEYKKVRGASDCLRLNARYLFSFVFELSIQDGWILDGEGEFCVRLRECFSN